MSLSRSVGCGNDRNDAGYLFGLGSVDALHKRAWVFRQKQRSMKHPGESHVVDVRAVSKSKFACLVTRPACADLSTVTITVERHFTAQRFAGRLDCLVALHVAGASAMMHAQDSVDLIVRRIRTFIQKVLGAGYYARRAEAALQTTALDKTIGEGLTFKLAKAFQRQDGLTCNACGRHRAGNHGPAVDDHRATATLTLWAATILGRDHPAVVSKHFKKRGSVFDDDFARR